MDPATEALDFERHEAALPTGPLTWFATGNGPPALYLHGRGGLRKSVAQKLIGAQRRIYLPVHPGFDGTDFHDGVASMPALAALHARFVRDRIGTPCDVIGHSFGGWLAAWMAADHPDLVRRLVLACPAGFRPGGAPSTTVDAEAVRRQLYVHPEKQPPDDRPAGMEDANRLRAPHYHGGMPLDEALVERLGDIRAPALMVHAAEDGLIPPETRDILSAGIPGLETARIDDAAHAVEIDQPERFAETVLAFLDR